MEGLRRQHAAEVQQEAQLAAEANAHKKNLGDRDLALRLPDAVRASARLTVTIVTRTAAGQTTTTARVVVHRRPG